MLMGLVMFVEILVNSVVDTRILGVQDLKGQEPHAGKKKVQLLEYDSYLP